MIYNNINLLMLGYILLIFLPFISYLLIFLNYDRSLYFERKEACYFSLLNITLSMTLSYVVFLKFLSTSVAEHLYLGKWFNIGYLNVDFLFIFDSLTCIML
jgi:NADH:ubiquinone oxidoreductase subunit 5 (subunit L)/multisubunit Na+/H+ antiporter MnhA subunit